MTHDNRDLDGLLAGARDAETPGAELVARVLADADAVQAGHPGAALHRAVPRRGLGAFLPVLGGWPGLSGLAAAAVAGLMFGVYAPDAVDTALGGQLSELGIVGQAGFVPGLDDLLVLEGG